MGLLRPEQMTGTGPAVQQAWRLLGKPGLLILQIRMPTTEHELAEASGEAGLSWPRANGMNSAAATAAIKDRVLVMLDLPGPGLVARTAPLQQTQRLLNDSSSFGMCLKLGNWWRESGRCRLIVLTSLRSHRRAGTCDVSF